MERPAFVITAIRLTMISRLMCGFPCRFRVMWRHLRRSIPVHPLVPGGEPHCVAGDLGAAPALVGGHAGDTVRYGLPGSGSGMSRTLTATGWPS